MMNGKKANGTVIEDREINSFRESIKKALFSKVEKEFENETIRATQEMTEERENAVKLISEEQKKAITQIVEDEKKAIWAKVMDSNNSEILNSASIIESISQAYLSNKSSVSGNNVDSLEENNGNQDVKDVKYCCFVLDI